MDANAILMAAASLAVSLISIIAVLAIGFIAHIRGSNRQRLSPIVREWISGQKGVNPTHEKLVYWARVATTDGVLGLLSVPAEEQDTFAGNGLQLVLDGSDEQQIRENLQPILDEEHKQVLRAVGRVHLVGIYCLLVGVIVPSIFGLLAMTAYKADSGIWVFHAFSGILLFIYGVTIFVIDIMVAGSFKRIANSIGVRRQMIIEALVMISAGQQADAVQEKLASMNAAGA